jgi:hypothetical protein
MYFVAMRKDGSRLKQPTDPNKDVALISKERGAQLVELDFLQRTRTLDVGMNQMENERPDNFDKENAY